MTSGMKMNWIRLSEMVGGSSGKQRRPGMKQNIATATAITTSSPSP